MPGSDEAVQELRQEEVPEPNQGLVQDSEQDEVPPQIRLLVYPERNEGAWLEQYEKMLQHFEARLEEGNKALHKIAEALPQLKPPRERPIIPPIGRAELETCSPPS